MADRKWKAEYFLDNQLDLGRCSFYNWQYPLTVCQMEKVHKFCICGEPFGYIEPAAALAPTKSKQVGREGDFCGYPPNQAAHVVIDTIENFTYEKWVSLPNLLVIQIVQC